MVHAKTDANKDKKQVKKHHKGLPSTLSHGMNEKINQKEQFYSSIMKYQHHNSTDNMPQAGSIDLDHANHLL